jgi:hypothetical protein
VAAWFKVSAPSRLKLEEDDLLRIEGGRLDARNHQDAAGKNDPLSAIGTLRRVVSAELPDSVRPTDVGTCL